MKHKKFFPFFLFLIIFLISICSFFVWTNEENQKETLEKGPHGGRLLKDETIALELFIFERAMPPHFRAYLYKAGALTAPEKFYLTVELTRFNGKKETITFNRADDFLQSEQVIHAPHSFDVAIQLEFQGKQFKWSYSSYEGRVKIAPAVLKAANIQTAVAQSQTIKSRLKVFGKITPNQDTLAPIYARYPGIIKAMTKNLGDEVTQGEVLMTVESNESLQNYTITAPINGTIVQKNATSGGLAQNTKPIYEVANLATVWADFTLYRKDAPLVKNGMEVFVTGDEGKPKSRSTISYISPLGIEDSQTNLARAVLANDQRIWLPGMYVNGMIIINEKKVPVAVLLSAIQQMEGHDVLFVQQGNFFEATPIILGQKDNKWVEVISGLDAGQHYVSKNSFFMKTELGKNEASHGD
ncbi:efflux RND transporter periplasmic adaptor subunit [Fluoribacter dumoffii]|uniref:Cation efflux system protein CzcB n=1 Tax=Fluoribacter dumoffii TaxID=463 RepID=A0A377GBF0_9GAMM|nr:efflux RND transporter periplasmic adaptor subunit [Fluoribacter dumoffii]KTC92838.1 HelB protein [Fluoribacter dumoffii NY 23]MCW8386135.1 efflux RND transporter periplasmic adaptor subunit [Fluoribacter dumoffii]MCW8419186.1 efflux RND transporter periplasmic adaptor subunit [Fluoribacter dumoffii]MCW8452939.1 efflux RND transporter periplasmic adaptor subunit [Fluoribacter dumoffii]MCW8459811.1 efflux RND transporter periplasmic adaptor subunit [Fluoribacter dumoffii]